MMARKRPSRGRGRHARANAGADRSAAPSPSLALTGLASVLLGVPLAVLASPTGPYDDPKAWAFSILTALSGLGWIVSARQRPTPSSSAANPGAHVIRGLALACIAWSVVATLA